ncbi:MAG: hypothetical protein NPIRA01_04130 [Nitrospirales bacterium]|nr:MAG: hypothetical protein NPIRA01_04130 [Nitrospirales bacterium]
MPSEQDKILVAGGYGQVGRVIAHELSSQFPGQVIVAGRSRANAEALATELGHGTQASQINVYDSGMLDEILDDVCLVIMCLDQREISFVRTCLELGINYIDLSAQYDFLKKVGSLDTTAKEHGATALLSVGLAPGLSNLLAAYAKRQFDDLTHLDIFIMLGLGDVHGHAAIAWLIDNLDAEFFVHDGGVPLRVKSFHESRACHFPGISEKQTAFRFNFSDQHVIPQTLRIPSVSTWLCFDSSFVTRRISMLAKRGLGRLARLKILRVLTINLLSKFRMGSDICTVMVQAHGPINGEQTLREYNVTGHGEAKLTGFVAAEAAQLVMRGGLAKGVFHLEQLVNPGDFFHQLSTVDPRFSYDLAGYGYSGVSN